MDKIYDITTSSYFTKSLTQEQLKIVATSLTFYPILNDQQSEHLYYLISNAYRNTPDLQTTTLLQTLLQLLKRKLPYLEPNAVEGGPMRSLLTALGTIISNKGRERESE